MSGVDPMRDTHHDRVPFLPGGAGRGEAKTGPSRGAGWTGVGQRPPDVRQSSGISPLATRFLTTRHSPLATRPERKCFCFLAGTCR